MRGLGVVMHQWSGFLGKNTVEEEEKEEKGMVVMR